MQTSIIKFTATDGLILHGALYEPNRKPKSAMLYVHGLGGTFYGDIIDHLSKSAVGSNMAFMSIETRGSYVIESFDYANSSKPELVAGSAMGRFEDSVHDMGGAVRFLKSRGYSKIIIVGKSTGCQKAIYYMYKKREKSVKGLVLLGPVDDYNIDARSYGKRYGRVTEAARRMERRNPNALMDSSMMAEDQKIISASRFLSTSDLRRAEGRLLNYSLGKLRELSEISVPVLAIFGSEDELLTISPEEALRKLGENCSHGFSSAVIKGAGHSLFANGRFPSKRIVSWAKGVL